MRKKNVKLPGIASGLFYENFGKFRFGTRQEDLSEREGHLSWSRFYIFYALLISLLLLFLGRLFNLTVISGERNRELSDNNRIRIVDVEGERGKIFDRRGRLLAYSQKKYSLKKDKGEVEISQEQVRDLESEGLAGEDFEGELGKIYGRIVRIYPYKEAASHILGYTSKVSQEDLEANPQLPFFDSVGRLGVESSFDLFLRGKVGKKLIEVDAIGRNISILGSVDSIGGRNIHLTIDANLQKVVYEALTKHAQKAGSKRGAVVIENPKTGEILALASTPGFNGEDIGRYVDDLEKPFFNRAISGVYPPGSIFKIVSALAGLESGKINRDTEVEDVGQFMLGGSRFSNWFFNQYGKKDGILKVDRAIARSNDIFFYRLGEEVGLNTLREEALALGFGKRSGIDLPDEAVGLVPDEVWKQSAYGDNWFLGDTMHLAIGQGFMLATPIQINSLISYVSTNVKMRPFLVSRIEGNHDASEINVQFELTGEDFVKLENLELVRKGMFLACQSGGTGWPFFDAPYKVGCKTGTAERFVGNPHAWFSVYAPFDDPQIALTVLIEEGGEGSSVAGPVAREIMDWWFNNK